MSSDTLGEKDLPHDQRMKAFRRDQMNAIYLIVLILLLIALIVFRISF